MAHDKGDFSIILVYCQWDVEIVDCHGGKGRMMGGIEDNTAGVCDIHGMHQPTRVE